MKNNRGYTCKYGCLWWFILSISMPLAYAQSDPIQLLDNVTSAVMKELKLHREEISKSPNAVFQVVEHLIVPHVDFVEMAKWVTGKSAWRKASENERNAFVHELKNLVVRTYVTALHKYTDEKIEFMPLRNIGGAATAERIQVSSKVIRATKEDLRVDYRLIASSGTWKVYDMIIEGVSILKGLQAQFSDEIRKQGLAPVIQKMKNHQEK